MSTQLQDKPPVEMDSPALASPEWLPETQWEDLEEMRTTHLRLLQTRTEAIAEVTALRERHEAEEKERADALQASYRDGTDPKNLPDVTPPEEQKKERDAVKERLHAVNKALDNFLRETEQRLEELAPDWLADMDSSDAEAMQRYEGAKAVMAAAQMEVDQRRKLRMWIHREAGHHPTFKATPLRHFPFGQMGDPPPEPEAITPETLRGGVQIA